LRDRQAEQAHLAHGGDDLGGNRIVVGDLVFERHQPLAHEAPDGFQQLVERFAVQGHLGSPVGGGFWGQQSQSSGIAAQVSSSASSRSSCDAVRGNSQRMK